MNLFFKGIVINVMRLLFLVTLAISADLFFVTSPQKAQLFHMVAGHYDEKYPNGSIDAMRYYRKAIATYEALGDTRNAATAYIQLGMVHLKFGNILQVERMVLTALELNEDNISPALRARSYLLLAGTVPPTKSREYINKAMVIAEAENLKTLAIKGYYLLGRAEEYEADFEQAEEYYLQAIDYLERYPSTRYYVDLVPLYEAIGELYAGGGEINKAINYYDTALAHSFRQNPKSYSTARFMQVLGDLYLEKDELAKACEFWKKSTEQYYFVQSVGSSVKPLNTRFPDYCFNSVS